MYAGGERTAYTANMYNYCHGLNPNKNCLTNDDSMHRIAYKRVTAGKTDKKRCTDSTGGCFIKQGFSRKLDKLTPK